MPSTAAERCPLCSSASTREFLRRGQVPVHQNLLAATQAQACAVPRGDLRMMVCDDCGFVFNAAFDPGLMDYGENYENTQSHSPKFARHMEELANHLLNECSVRGSIIVEVGCGKGGFLRLLVAGDPGNRGIGFDPSYVGEAEDFGGRLRFERRMYGSGHGDLKPDAVVCRHVIEHVARPVELLRQIRRALPAGARLFFETPCVRWILENTVVWDFFYEHCSLFCEASLAAAFRAAGFRAERVRRLFGDQYLWIEASVAGNDEYRSPHATSIPLLAQTYSGQADAAVARWIAQVESLKARGKVAIWGAGAKGATFVDLVDRDRSRIDCVVDINPSKQGQFIPGTGHPIVAPRELAERGIGSTILMNPNYALEIRDLLERERIDTRLVA